METIHKQLIKPKTYHRTNESIGKHLPKIKKKNFDFSL